MEFDQWKTGLFGRISEGQGPGRLQDRRLPWPWLRPPLMSSTSNPCFKTEQKVQGMLRRSHGGPELERRLRCKELYEDGSDRITCAAAAPLQGVLTPLRAVSVTTTYRETKSWREKII
ncbi:hypothetical protein Q3G72_016291 [Acer saccharum]|nr:hypothetical protein Q3G72_016291 [Acer saccharum]